MKEIYPIDKDGWIIWDNYRFEEDDYEPLEDEIDVKVPRDITYIQSRWDGKAWVEGAINPPKHDPDTETIHWDNDVKQWMIEPKPPEQVNPQDFVNWFMEGYANA